MPAYGSRSSGGGGGGGGGSGGSGGGSGLAIKDLWSGNITGVTANQWVALGTTPVPSDAIFLIWNGGKFSTGTDDGPAALWTWINAVDWRALTADTVGSTPGDGTGMLFVDWGATNIGDGTPDFSRRDAVIGRTSGNIPLILTTNTSEEFVGASLKYVTFTEPAAAPADSSGGGIGDATGGLPAGTADLVGEVRIDRNTLIEYVCVERYNVTAVATGTWADIPDRADLEITPDRADVTVVDGEWVYETDDNAFYAGTVIAPSRLGWVQDNPDDALASSLADTTNTVVWISEHPSDEDVLAILTSITDGEEYFYFNTDSGTIRRLTNSTFTAAGTPIVYYPWLPTRSDPPVANAGYVVDVTRVHHPPPASTANAQNIYIDQSLEVPRLWLPHQRGAPDTAPSLTFTVIASTAAGFRGVHYVNPDPSAALDWYYNRNNHTWRYRPAGQSHFNSVSFTELKNVAMQGGSLYFAANDVFLNEVNGRALAAQIIENGGYNSDGRDYFWIQGNALLKLNVFTAAVTNRVVPDYVYLDAKHKPPPTAIWYINGQTERWPSSYAYTQDPSSNRLRARWSGDDPNESRWGWDLIGDIWVLGSEVSTDAAIDFSAAPSFSTDNVVFSPPGGVYDIEVTLGLDREDLVVADEFAILLYQIVASTDDKILATSSSRISNLPANFGGVGGTVFRMDAPDLELDGTEQLYVLMFNNDNSNWRGFMRISKKE